MVTSTVTSREEHQISSVKALVALTVRTGGRKKERDKIVKLHQSALYRKSFFVWAAVHKDVRDVSFLLDTGATVSIISRLI